MPITFSPEIQPDINLEAKKKPKKVFKKLTFNEQREVINAVIKIVQERIQVEGVSPAEFTQLQKNLAELREVYETLSESVPSGGPSGPTGQSSKDDANKLNDLRERSNDRRFQD